MNSTDLKFKISFSENYIVQRDKKTATYFSGNENDCEERNDALVR